MWIILERWLKVLEFFIILSLIFILFQWWIYNDKRAFKKYVLSDFKGKSKFFIFMYKFSALNYIEYPLGTGSIFVNSHKKNNVLIFGKKYMEITLLCATLSLISAFLLVGGIPYNKLNTLVFLTQVKNQEQSLDFFEGKLTSLKKIKQKKQPYYMLSLSRKGKEKKFTAILDKEIRLRSFLRIGYFKKYNYNKFMEVDEVVSIDVNSKNIQNLENYLSKLKKAIYFQQNIGISGAFLSLTMYFLLWIRYKKYGFKGVNKLIVIKKKEFKEN